MTAVTPPASQDSEGLVTPTWWQWRQMQADAGPGIDYEQLRAEADAHREREERFLSLFRSPTPKVPR